MKRNKAYKFRIYPNREQEILFQKTFGCCRFIYNQMLNDKIEHYKKTKEMLHNTPAMYKSKYEWLKEADSLALANVQLNLQKGYSKFFKEKNIGFPKFKSKKRSRKSYTTNNQKDSIYIKNGYIKLPKAGKVRIRVHRSISNEWKLKSVTVSQSGSGRYYASVLYEYEIQVSESTDADKSVGLDFSMPELYVDSSGSRPQMPHFYRRAEKRLAKAQRRLSKMYVKGAKEQSHRYMKQKKAVAVLHEKTANQRRDFLHKQSRALVDAYDYIFIEDLNMQGMSKTMNFGKSVHDNGWGAFVNMISYKAEEAGKHLIKIDKWYPSSQICHVCGVIDGPKALHVRKWECSACGAELDRDINAAINIRQAGLSMI